MSERDKVAVSALKGCESREMIEDTFRLYDIDDKNERTQKLNECMGNPETYFSSDKISDDEKYELTIQMFLTKSWTLNEYYDRMGIGV